MLQGKENSLLTTFKNLHLSPNKWKKRSSMAWGKSTGQDRILSSSLSTKLNRNSSIFSHKHTNKRGKCC